MGAVMGSGVADCLSSGKTICQERILYGHQTIFQAVCASEGTTRGG